MYIGNIKTKIFLTIASLLLIGMFLIDFVLLITGQREYIQSEVERAETLATIISEKFPQLQYHGRLSLDEKHKESLAKLFVQFGYSKVVLCDYKCSQTILFGDNTVLKKPIQNLIQKCIVTNQTRSKLIGDTWGVFWRQEQNILIAVPVYNGNQIVAGVGFIFPLNTYYKHLRRSQKFVFFYMMTNAVLLALIGLYRMHQITLKPVNRLVKKAEEYQDDRNFAFFYEKEENEIGSLSKALNRMMSRISDDKQVLKTSLASLEKSNVELKKVRQEIIRAEKLASVGRLAAGIAHEIGNPIGIVLGYLGLLKQKAISDAERDDFIIRSENEITRINTIIRQLLDFSRPGNDLFAAISVHQVIEEVVELLKVQPLLVKIKIERFLTAQKDIVLMDPNQLRQILINLFLNAGDAIDAKKCSEGGLIRIETEDINTGRNQSNIKIQLIDNGIGIPSDCFQNIFDPFFSTKEPGRGTGLGLSVCFMILDQIGGTIQAFNNEPGGTIIQVCLPLHEPADLAIVS